MTLMGEYLKMEPKRGPEHSRGGGSNGSKREPLPDAPPTLADLGIGKKESSASQALHTRSRTMNAIAVDVTAEAQALLEQMARRCLDLAAVLPTLELPAGQLQAVAGELQRIAVRLALVEEQLAEMGPG